MENTYDSSSQGEEDYFSTEDEEELTNEETIKAAKDKIKIPKHEYICIVCSHKEFSPYPRNILEHMLNDHRVVIGDLEKIANIPKYLEYWNKRFQGNSVEEFCSSFRSQINPHASVEFYFMLSDILPEDKKVREDLRNQTLAEVIAKQQEERSLANFNRRCLFCRDMFPSRKSYFSHMFHKHNFNVGLPDNMVNVDELLDILQSKIDSNICLYCEKLFKNYSVLKLHMRKKKHFKINSKNKDYDRFYIVNYLDPGKPWEEIQKEIDSEKDEPEEEDWDEWSDDNEEDGNTVCIFCPQLSESPLASLEHAKKAHNFDLKQLQKDWKLDLYATIRLVNYLRYQISANCCPLCGGSFESPKHLAEHLEATKHYGVPPNGKWKTDEQYLLPVSDEDPILRVLEPDVGSDDEDNENVPQVLPEDVDIKQDRVKEIQKALEDAHLFS